MTSSAGPDVADQRLVFSGEPNQPRTEKMYRTNRPVKPRQRSLFSIIVTIVLVSLLIVVYIWNKISVNRLTEEVNQLHNQHDQIANANAILRAEINKKSRLERIGKIAIEQLGLINPSEQPIWFEVDPEHLEQLQNRE